MQDLTPFSLALQRLDPKGLQRVLDRREANRRAYTQRVRRARQLPTVLLTFLVGIPSALVAAYIAYRIGWV